MEHGVVTQGAGQQDEVRGPGHGDVVQGGKGSELAMHEVLNTGF